LQTQFLHQIFANINRYQQGERGKGGQTKRKKRRQTGEKSAMKRRVPNGSLKNWQKNV
jgi:hypothetical protein